MRTPDRDMLMAYADGQLDEATRRNVEAYLAGNADAAAEVAWMQRQNDAIQTLFAPTGAEPVPARLHARRIAAQAGRQRNRSLGWAAAAIVLVGLGLGGGWMLRPLLDTRSPSATLIADAVNAHNVYVAENRHAVEVGSNDAEHLSSWLSNRLDTTLGMPDLAAEGFTLVGAASCRASPTPAGGRLS